MIRITFVCLGNICRSPMAEAVMRHQVAEAGLAHKIQVTSSGTAGWHKGKPPHEGTRGILNKYRISYEGQRASQVEAEHFHEFHYIIAMDSSNLADLQEIAPSDHQAKLSLFTDWIPNCRVKDVPDPYYTGNFEEVYELVNEGCAKLLSYLRTQ